ncbi:MAG: 2-oxoglutarate dehydrogenase complex dihydrolipoyllysine-residue succinyltransferase [Flavobacteriales bacterium]|nr:2-oxoglutarate dehydrogenase complex dihydrolipoyllysine-residue succinyltransferase [Flavobacteriales bacterium]MCW8912443.1 2-oxoglutarate dehydrogenase complex dihydrolipoyllysine-residue succinyltransferase [Flavobacteriales bacterium]MCW8936527.1 2-oxoglutarate dehydrogenase complex dihydrolipoyllysine-residue succinyltransferase [Flavobacteriales bacterium]MCW8969210.1 2-oxoglutarate dehydrogenase complex dihydrolipoyllysine-residue succinyltransferase [Flavobacteriales bacterium]MCW89
MALEMKVPSPGESITEVEIAQWLVEDGDYVEKDQAIAEVDSDKATLELPAEEAGIITLKAEEGDLVKVGAVVCLIDTDAKKPEGFESKSASEEKVEEKTEAAPKKEEVVPNPAPATKTDIKATPLAKEMISANNINTSKLKGSGSNGKITKNDIQAYLTGGIDSSAIAGWGGTREQDKQKMSMLRRKVAQRLVSVKNETAMLTTFNEVDMKPIMDLRNQFKDKFKETHGVSLGFMSFFTKAVTEALRQFPAVNGMIDGDFMITHDYADIGIAVSSPKGLMVPVVRNAEKMSLAEIEAEIKRLAIKARDGKIDIADMEGGTFTITNGGVFGSMMSTPIINPPQSAILGMHNIIDRPIAVDGKVEIRPMMYVALSYDHRIIDGKESVGFLKAIKEMLENPSSIIFGGKNPDEVLLNL